MIHGLDPIPIKDIKSLTKSKFWDFEGFLDELPSLTPVRGTITVESDSESIKIKGNFSSIVNLTCDRCQMFFNHTLEFNSEELMWIGQTKKSSANFQLDEYSEYLDPQSDWDPERWVFEQLSLQMPLLNICTAGCLGTIASHNENQIPTSKSQINTDKKPDPRWAELKKLL